MAVGSPRPPDTHRDGDRATTVYGLVEILVGTAAPTALRCLPRWEDIVSAARTTRHWPDATIGATSTQPS